MLCLDENRVCKPVIEQELEFYCSLPVSLQKYTPNFLGVVEVNVVEEDEYMCLVASNGTDLKNNSSRDGR